MVTQDSVAVDRARRLFEYLEKVAQLQSVVIRDIANSAAYEEIVWLGLLPDAPEIRSAVRSDPGLDGEWLVVSRPPFVGAPKPPVGLEPWLEPIAIRDSAHPLTLKTTATIIVDVTTDDGEVVSRAESVDLSDFPDVVEAFAGYLEGWSVWAAEDRRLQPIQDVYSRLHAVEQRVRILQELYELVLGVGLLTVPRSTGVIRRHLLVAKADIRLDPESGRITVSLSGDGIDLHVEDEMIDASDLPPGEVTRALATDLEEIDDPIPTRLRRVGPQVLGVRQR